MDQHNSRTQLQVTLLHVTYVALYQTRATLVLSWANLELCV
jgi:hypothetical protein